MRLRPDDAVFLGQRFGRIPAEIPAKENRTARVWIHAASVGEVGAAVVLIRELTANRKDLRFVVSTMTTSGQAVAGKLLPETASSFVAPFDLMPAVRRMVEAIGPDIYVCLETELWPVMLGELQRAGICKVLLNGRMTERSLQRYFRVPGLMRKMVQGFSAIAVIRPQDGKRFTRLGAIEESIRYTGNIKYDFSGEDIAAVRQGNRSYLQVNDEIVFICGSTRSGEEEILAKVYRELCRERGSDPVWVIAPRHMDRLADIKAMLTARKLPYDLYSELGCRKREHRVVLVDCLGELARLYSAGDFNFVGGSLVRCGGHNLMEAARWGRPVYYGPHTDDFSDAADILETAGAGFPVKDGSRLAVRVLEHMRDKKSYEAACRNALEAVERQHGAAKKQAAILLTLLQNKNNKES